MKRWLALLLALGVSALALWSGDAAAQIVRPAATPRAAATDRPESVPRIPGLGDSAYAALILESSPAIYYQLNESSGTNADDASTNARDGEFAGSPTLQADGVTDGGAVSFDGSDDRLTIDTPYSPTHTDITFEAWIKIPAAANPTNATMFSWQENGGSGGGIAFGFGNAPGAIGATGVIWCGWTEPFVVELTRTVTATYNDGNWHHVACVYDGSAGVEFDASLITLYVDGAAATVVEETFANYSDTAPHATNRLMMAGTLASGWDNFVEIVLDEMVVYETTISAAVISSHYDAGAP